MATLNELGRNSASLTYGPFATGQDQWPTFQLMDTWIRNDTLQGYVTASSTNVTGVGTIFTTQVRAGDIIMIAGQMRTVAGVTSDTAFTVTAGFSPTITLASAVKVINTTLSGTITTVVRGDTNGVVSVTNGSATVTGVGTFFLSDATNSVTTSALSGTVALGTDGTITGTGTTFQSQAGTVNGLYPGDSISITLNGAVFFYTIATVTSDTAATITLTSVAAISGGATIAKAANGVSGRTIIINGKVRTISSIQSNTALTLNYAMDITDSNLFYKVYPRGTLQNATGTVGAFYGTTSATGSGTTLTVAATVSGVFIPGAIITGTGVPAGTFIVNQQFGATGAGAATTTATGTSGTNSITVASATGIVVGHLICGNGAVVAGIANGTYVTSISGTTVTLSQNLTGALSSTSVSFYVGGGTGAYTTNVATTISAAACFNSSVQGTNTNFLWDLVTGDQVWIGDELRTFNFNYVQAVGASGATNAWLTDYTGYSGTAIGRLFETKITAPFHREDTYITGSGTSFTTELRVGDDLIIDGTECTVIQILSATQFRINIDFSHSTSGATVYKKKKIHGFVLEGTREGAATGNKWSVVTTSVVATGTNYVAGANQITVATATSFAPFQFIKIQGAGGPAVPLTGQATVSTTAVTGVNTQFTTQLHVGAEICIGGQYAVVASIASDTACTLVTAFGQAVVVASPIYRTTPLYTQITAVAGSVMTLFHSIKNTVYSNGFVPPAIYTAAAATDHIEFVYSAPNKSAEATTTLFNTSLDRKYFGFRMFPLAQGGGSGTAIGTSGSAYNITVYERWTAAHNQTNGVGINRADQSDSSTILSGVVDQTAMVQTTGGFLYLFAKPRYFIVQGKTFGGGQLAWLGCVEFERSQPEDTGTGLGSTTGVSIFTGNPVSGTPGVSPWPCFAYFNGNRFPVGSAQTPTAPTTGYTQAVHGGIFSVPRLRLSTGDLVGLNAHVYSAATITTGRWGHLWEIGGSGASYLAPTTAIGAGVATLTANSVPVPHMGHLVPVYTNVYNSKRFMFSPVVVLGPAYDPDIRGRIYGLKVIPSALGTLMDTVSVTIDSNDFYDSTQTAADHWVITATTGTFRFSLAGTNFQSTRSLEDTGAIAANTSALYPNNFRWAIPA